jgi:hypothetical protein
MPTEIEKTNFFLRTELFCLSSPERSTPMPTAEQQAVLEQPFAPQEIKSREGHFGQTLDYIETHAVIQRLNDAFGGDWSFDVREFHIREDVGEVVVLGQLRAGGISKTQFGSSRLTRKRGSEELLGLGDDLKAAASDAIKKAATLLGVGLHLYRSDDAAKKLSPAAAPKSAASGQPLTSAPAPPPDGAQPSVSRSGSGAAGRLSARQHELILQLAGERGMSRQELDRSCQQHYDRVVDYLSRADASAFISWLLTRQASGS